MKGMLEKICQCGICLDILKDPKTLNCEHTFCRECLEPACTQNNIGLISLFCPSCRARQPLVYQKTDLQHINTSLVIKQVLDVLREWNLRYYNFSPTLCKKNNPRDTLRLIFFYFPNAQLLHIWWLTNYSRLSLRWMSTLLLTNQLGEYSGMHNVI